MNFKDGYKYDLKPRYEDTKGHPIIRKLLDSSLPKAEKLLDSFRKYEKALSTFPIEAIEDTSTFYWNNDFFPALDALSLYGFMAERNPRRYLEIGSGFSTKIARSATIEEGLDTVIYSVDPYPRAEVDKMCDRVFRYPLEALDTGIFLELEPNDILFFDGSHRALTNSDVTVFFCDILPLVKPGVVIQIHDICWPEDYPSDWSDRFYNEQYLLAQILIHAPEKLEVLLPCAHVSRSLNIFEKFPLTIGRPGLCDSKRGGGSFWFIKTS